jgi:O-acetyl-ADP-ribose deacetylase (regulator of RNase III)
MERSRGQWTNPSVVAFAEDRDPVVAVTERARELAMDAMDHGWAGPPFDPLALAAILRIDVLAREGVRDARTVPNERGDPRIEYNPTRPRGRVRYSLAHEIAHAMFPDWADKVRNRSERYELTGDEWQLEALCNIAAAEFVMPIGSFTELGSANLGIDRLLDEQKKYDVSMEALLIRAVHLRDEPCAIFCASPIAAGSNVGRYRVDYLIGSRSWKTSRAMRGGLLPERTLIRKCGAIGFTAKGNEVWGDAGEMRIEAVGIPPYPGSVMPRVVGVLLPIVDEVDTVPEFIEFVFGDATKPAGDDLRIIAHVVSDGAMIWGGGGFAAAVRRAWPHAQEEFREWISQQRGNLSLGRVHFSSIQEGVQVASIVAQKGYGPSDKPRIRYGALRHGLTEVARIAVDAHASVHMPRIGTGMAGGSWELVAELVKDAFAPTGLHVTVYDLPGRRSNRQTSLFPESGRGTPSA